jgi:glucose-6-phosphate 1-dehydrogenase
MTTEPTLFVVLGATGDLYRRKLLPALHRLLETPNADVHILGAATSDLDDAAFRTMSREALEAANVDPSDAQRWCEHRLHYEAVPRDAGYESLSDRIAAIESDHGLPGNRVFYLALPPRVFPAAIEALGAAGLAAAPGWTRLVVEKPFGRDAESAVELDRVVHRHFDESQVYRIDHYLGKETVQNLLVFRFTNPIFESSWNRDRIARVEITVAEALDVGDRSGYYDRAGVVRDMMQNHLTQLLTLIAMESPAGIQADAIRDEKVKVLRAVRPLEESEVVYGQYEGYRSADGVAADSTTPTYAAARVRIDNWRWQGVPFVLRTGKAMERRTTQIAVTFVPPPICLFHERPDACIDHSDVLYLTLQPDEGFSLEIEVKEPGDSGRLRTVPLRFSYEEAFGEIPDAYETLLGDVLEGDQTLFVRSDEVAAAWGVFGGILDPEQQPHGYTPGSWGPAEALAVLGDDTARWATG